LGRIKKSVPGYRAKADAIRQYWHQVKALCSQAAQFESAVQAALILMPAAFNDPPKK
jgi:hypothetical protein